LRAAGGKSAWSRSGHVEVCSELPPLVLFGAKPASNVTYQSPTSIQATVPAGSGIVDVVVINGNGAQGLGVGVFTFGGSRRPGDCNGDGRFDLTDSILLLSHLYTSSPTPLPCGDGESSHPANRTLLDVNGDGSLDLSDAVYSLFSLFLGGPPPVLGTTCTAIESCTESCNG